MTPRMSHLIRHPLVMGALTLIASLWSTGARADAIYSITDLGTLSGQSSSVATSINDQGQIVGISYNSSSGYFTDTFAASANPPRFTQTGKPAESFLDNGGQMSQINPTGGLAMSINNSGQVVGGQYSSINGTGQYVGGQGAGILTDNPTTTSVLVSGGITTTLSPLFVPYSINASAQVAGLLIADNQFHPAVYQNGQTKDLFPALGIGGTYDSRAIAINQNGDVAINVSTANNSTAAYIYSAATGLATEIKPPPGSPGLLAAALNNEGQVVGNGFLYSAGAAQALASLLPAGSGWTDLGATSINDLGQIVGQGTYDGQQVAFLMTPNANGVPEPSTVAIWCLMSAALAARARILRNGGGDLALSSCGITARGGRVRKQRSPLTET